MSRELNEQQNASVGMTVGMIEVRFDDLVGDRLMREGRRKIDRQMHGSVDLTFRGLSPKWSYGNCWRQFSNLFFISCVVKF